MTTLKTLINSETAQAIAAHAADLGLTVNEIRKPLTRRALVEQLQLGRLSPEQWSDAEKGLHWLTRRRAGQVKPCRSCGAYVLWVISAKNRQAMPLDPLPRLDGNLILTVEGRGQIARVLKQPAKFAGPRFQAHFVTCPHAAQMRASRKHPVVDAGARCTECGEQLHRVLVDAGETTHWLCGPPPGERGMRVVPNPEGDL